MIIGSHVLFYSTDADKDREFFRDVLEFPYADAGHGWLIFGLPPTEAAWRSPRACSSPARCSWCGYRSRADLSGSDRANIVS